ncbi:DegV family protein [Chloroflexota bacterium]
MSKIAVVTDSTATIPEEIVKKYNIYVAPLHVTWDKIRYRDGVDLKQDEFYKRLRKSSTLPTTSSAIQGEFLQIFEDLKGKVDGVVAVLLSSALGAACNSATSAKSMVSDLPVEIVDSKLVTTGLGFGAIAAAKVASAGGSIEQIAKAAKDVLSNVYVYFAMDTLEYMRRGGRVSLPKAILASWLRVKPVMMISKEGKIEPVSKPRTMSKAIDTLLNLMKEKVTNTPLHVSIMHADNPDGVEMLKREITSNYQCAELFIEGLSPVIGTHFGPDALSIAFYNE